MIKNKVLSFILVLLIFCILPISANENSINISNKFFCIKLPMEAKNLYKTKKIYNGIFVYHKDSYKAGFGGLAFGIQAYKNPSDHAMMPGGTKIGELSKKKDLYDIVLVRPTDVQHDYTKPIPESYKYLYSIGDNVNITGKGKCKYHKDQGMKGEDLYSDIIKKHITAINEKWDSTKLEKENMSYMYNVLAQDKKNKNILDKVGYAYYDINGDGIEELLIGEISNGAWKGVVYDIYTMVNREPKHVVSGGNRDRYFVCDNSFLCNERSSGAKESLWLIYILVENSVELYPQVGFKYDSYESDWYPWYISYNFLDDKWDNVSEKEFKERKAVFDKYERFNFTPLSKIKL